MFSVDKIFSAIAAEYALRAAASRLVPVKSRDGRGLRINRSSRVNWPRSEAPENVMGLLSWLRVRLPNGMPFFVACSVRFLSIIAPLTG